MPYGIAIEDMTHRHLMNMQNIPSKSNDIRHMFRATPGYVLLSSDYSQQEPKLTAFVSQDENMITAFKEGKDIYSTIAAISFGKTYEECKEFTPTGEYNPDGKARRTEAKSVVLGILYGRSIPSIADQLYSHEEWDDERKIKQAQFVYDSVLNAFPALRQFMISSQKMAHDKGYVETILGRRRHIPDMTLPEFEFEAMPGYVNPDIDPLDPSTFTGEDGIPKRIKDALYKELTSYKYPGQKFKRIKELAEKEKIKVINNGHKISEASRQVVNCVDFETEILTCDGWKRYDGVEIGDWILSFNTKKQRIEADIISAVHIYGSTYDAVEFEDPNLPAIATHNHRWIIQQFDGESKFVDTDELIALGSAKLPMPASSTISYSDVDWVDVDTTNYVSRTVTGVWCVSTYNSTWIARRNGKVFITGNSIIQGEPKGLTAHLL